MADHEYTPGRKAVRGDVDGRACIICGNLADECIAPIVSFPVGETVIDQPIEVGPYDTITGSKVSAPPPVKPRKQRRKRSA